MVSKPSKWKASSSLLASTFRKDLRLEIAAVAETVIVTGETPLVQVESTEISSIVSQEQITQLPVLNRSYLSLALLVPGTSADVNRGFFESVQVGGGAAFNSTGNFVDGVTNNWVEDGEPRQDIPEDAVEQFKVANAQFKPEYGMATAGVIQTVTKSGTNNVHGTGYWYFRDRALNAIGEFEEEKTGLPTPPVRWEHRRADCQGRGCTSLASSRQHRKTGTTP